MRSKALQMCDRGRHTLATEAVKRPDEQEVELTPCRASEHRCKLLSVFGALTAAFVLDIFAHQRVAHTLAPFAQLKELIIGGLPFVVCRDPGVDRHSHSHKMSLL